MPTKGIPLMQDRRKNKPPSRMPAVLALVFSGIFLFAMISLVFFEIPNNNKETFVLMCGTIGTMVSVAAGFYFNTTQSSKHKDQILADQLAIKTKSEDEQ